ncbi:uncharacterized protein [Ptychodera flava]|uniref:uncharacterized protein n=1 Tax=Ptychodera flava TaxID=63121 RepID=UPI00396A3D1E
MHYFSRSREMGCCSIHRGWICIKCIRACVVETHDGESGQDSTILKKGDCVVAPWKSIMLEAKIIEISTDKEKVLKAQLMAKKGRSQVVHGHTTNRKKKHIYCLR